MGTVVLVVHRSNRMEALVESLARELARPLSDPFVPETLLIQSRGMQRWLSMQLCERLGVWANAEFPFPRAFFERLFCRLRGEPLDAASAYSRGQLTWTIAAELERLRGDPLFQPVASYLGDSPDPVRRLELGRKIAGVFDQYVVYRADVVARWESGEGEGWQPALWRRIVRRHGTEHFASRARDLMSLPTMDSRFRDCLPQRISVIGISSLPPIYVALLGRLAEAIDVHCYWLSPCREYWAFTRSPRDLGRIEAAGGGESRLEHWELGSALLGGLGRQGREFLQVLEEAYQPSHEEDVYIEPGDACSLHVLQGDVLGLRARGHDVDLPRVSLRPGDRSLQVHSCHSTQRQLEVLKDVLLEEFRRDPSLMPHDVIVMAPDIERTAPLIDAVFAAGEDDEPHIPYCIADRPLGAGAELVQAFLALLRVLGARLKASEVLDLLQHRPIRERFELTPESIAPIRDWVTRAGIRWARDAGHRGQHGVPELDSHTWRFGLRRLLLGAAMPARLAAPFAGVLPCEGAEGSSSPLLGAFAEFTDAVIAAQRRLPKLLSMPEWSELLTNLLESFLRTDDEYAAEGATIRAALRDFGSEAERAEMLEPLPLRYVERELEGRLTDEKNGHQFMAGGVTFCALLPMRSVPFRVVCLIDMDDGVFPRNDSPPSFDLIAAEPRLGDRSLREEDRYLFLEALLSARQTFAVFYSGRGLHDAQPRPPSGVVSELLDVVDASLFVPSHGEEETSVRALLVVEHPLMPYSTRYFASDGDPRLFSYSRMYADAARCLVSERVARPRPFQVRELDLPDQAVDVRLDELGRFLEHPLRVYAERELGLRLAEFEVTRLDREPLELDHLARYTVGQTLLNLLLEGREPGEAELLVRAAGLLPHHALGRHVLQRLWGDVEPIAAAVRRLRGSAPRSPTPVDLRLDPWRLLGLLRDTHDGRLVMASFARISARQRLRAWLGHLALSASGERGACAETVLIARQPSGSGKGGRVATFQSVTPENARAWLNDLCEIYGLGRRGPLPFFPDAAEAYANRLLSAEPGDSEARTRALDAARKVLRAGKFSGGGDSADQGYVARFLEGLDPLQPNLRVLRDSSLAWPDFEALAIRVYGPLAQNSTEQST